MAKLSNLEILESMGADTAAVKAKWEKWKKDHPKNDYPVGKVEKDLWDGLDDKLIRSFCKEAVKQLLG